MRSAQPMSEQSEQVDRTLSGKVAIITGAASGIGRAITILFVRQGAAVIAADIDHVGIEITRGMTGSEEHCIAVEADVSRERDWHMLVRMAVQRYGQITTLVNNAAISVPGTVLEVSLDDFEHTWSVNVRSMLLGCRAAIPVMLRSGNASIINMGSVNSMVAERMLASYCISKGAVLMLTKSVALDFAAQGIRCNCICPGWVNTPINLAHSERLGGIDAVRQQLPLFQPMGREGRPDEIAAVASFLASDASSFLTGAAIPVDGGFTAQ